MASLNQCNFIGRTGKEPELRYTNSGDAVATVSLAVEDRFKGKDGNKKTEWVNVVFWKQLAEIVGKYVGKGDLIFISGRMQTRSYDDKDGNKRYVTEIVADQMTMLGGSGDNRQQSKPAQGGGEPTFNPDDQIPF